MRWLKNVACRGDITNGYKILHNKQNNVFFYKHVNQLSSLQNLTQPLHAPSTCISSFKANNLPCGWKGYNLAYWTLNTFSYWINILAPVYCLKLEIHLILINSYVFSDSSSIYMSFNVLHLLYSSNYIKAVHLMHCEHIFQELYILN